LESSCGRRSDNHPVVAASPCMADAGPKDVRLQG